MLHIYFMQQWYALSDPAVEDALYDIEPIRCFAQLPQGCSNPDETTILKFRHLLREDDRAVLGNKGYVHFVIHKFVTC